MNQLTTRLFKSNGLVWFTLILVLAFCLLRFVHINADFPPGISSSGDLYTDEGWYTNAAVRQVLTGNWYMQDDVNFTAISMPIGQILQFITFSLLGPSLASARITISICFLLMLLFEALMIRNRFGNLAALLSMLLLSTNFFTFIHSRLALVYLPALLFITASLFIALGGKSNLSFLRIFLSSIFLVLAILTSLTSGLAIPLLLYICWRRGRNLKERLLLCGFTGLILLFFVGGYFLLIKYLFPFDFSFFKYAASGKFFTNYKDWRWNFSHKLIPRLQIVGPGFFELTLLLTTVAFIFSRRFRADPLVHALIGFAVIYIAILSINAFSPSRYYVLLIVPFSGLCAVACTALIEKLEGSRIALLSLIPVLLIFLSVIYGSWKIVSYLSKPDYTFYNMTQDIENILLDREGSLKNVMLFGDISDSVSLETHTIAANSLMYTSETVIKRLQEYHPKYLIVRDSQIDQAAQSLGGQVTVIGAWDVFGNYYSHKPVRLFLVEWPVN